MSFNDGYVFMKDRKEWKDVQPMLYLLFYCLTKEMLCIILVKDIFGYFKRVVASGEKSERVFSLITEAIELNPANYSLWSYRRELIDHLDKDIKQELEYVSKLMINDLKIYQLWYHRMELVKMLDDYNGELDFCDIILKEDPKNYHTWQYRHWLVDYFKLWGCTREMQLVEELLNDDPYNNSVWHYRYQLLLHNDKLDNEDTLKKELSYVVHFHIAKHPDNECAWNYLNGIFKFLDKATQINIINQFENQLDTIERQNDVEQEKNLRLMFDFVSHYYFNHICELESDSIDIVRKGYWTFLLNQIQSNKITTSITI